MSIATVHGYSMFYVTQRQIKDTPAGVLANTVTAVNNSPGTFSSGVVPNTLKELNERYTVANDFGSGVTTAWTAIQWVTIGSGRHYRWDGTTNKWVAATLATGVGAGATERKFTGGRYPQTVEELESSDFGQTDAWDEGQFVYLVKTGGTDKYYWDGTEWQAGEAPAPE